jgi:hypothetical protein
MEIVNEIRRKAKDLIVRGNLIEALNVFNQFNSEYQITNSDFENHYISISGTFFSNRKRYQLGNLDITDYNIIESKITVSFLTLIDDLENLAPENIVKKNAQNDYSNNNGIIASDYFDVSQIFYTIGKIINTDDKINDLKITIDSKKIEISKTSNKDKIEELNHQINELKDVLEIEKNNYTYLKNRYDELEQMYQNQNQNEPGKDINIGDNINIIHTGDNLLEKLIEIKAYHDVLSDQIVQIRLMVEEKINIANDKQLGNFSIIMQYLDDLNRKMSKLGK